jgi:hypothetical protein
MDRQAVKAIPAAAAGGERFPAVKIAGVAAAAKAGD